VKRKNSEHDSEWHLLDPRTLEWLVQCTACKGWGYRADVSPKFVGQTHLEKHFEKMKLDKPGICNQRPGAGEKFRRSGKPDTGFAWSSGKVNRCWRSSTINRLKFVDRGKDGVDCFTLQEVLATHNISPNRSKLVANGVVLRSDLSGKLWVQRLRFRTAASEASLRS
jgi:hypothetical protein